VEEDLRFAVIECKTSCPRCGGPIFLNGPAERVHCDRCQSEVDTPPDLWKSILETVVEDMGGFQEGEGSNSTMFTGNFQLSLTYGRLKPYCPSCKTEFPPVQDRPGENSWELTCGNCGEKCP